MATHKISESKTARTLALVALLPLLASCFTITVEPRALVLRPDGVVEVRSLSCLATAPSARIAADARRALDPRHIRLLTWNIHKEGDAGWEHDLATFAQANDLVLLQEVSLPRLRPVIESAGLQWVMASSFLFGADDLGVLTASRVEPMRSCTLRAIEPLLRLPKSAVIAWFRLPGREQTLAVVNVHAINFSLSLEEYHAQLQAIVDALVDHRGPIILAGDLNTWSAGRTQIAQETARRLGAAEIALVTDQRALFFGKPLDHVFIRGLEVIESSATPVTSSDHNPISVTLRVAED